MEKEEFQCGLSNITLVNFLFKKGFTRYIYCFFVGLK